MMLGFLPATITPDCFRFVNRGYSIPVVKHG